MEKLCNRIRSHDNIQTRLFGRARAVYTPTCNAAKRVFNFTFSLLTRCLIWRIASEVAMSTWNLGIDDVSEETQAFKDKLASKGKLGCSLKVCVAVYGVYR